mmetsp:Transcript_21103/g.37838  ORF Transcript_21103/g.37838 Transcript_21103/m.37838 type:complete len:227 (-) Transcript_21103:226-906(-)
MRKCGHARFLKSTIRHSWRCSASCRVKRPCLSSLSLLWLYKALMMILCGQSSCARLFFRHEINLRECTRIAAGWACLFVVCYAPWFVVLVISYRGRSFCTKGEASYIYIFMFFLGVNFVLNCGAACIAVFDRGVLCTDRARTKRWINRVIGLYTATFIAFNVYGLTLLWVPSGRESNCSLQPETLAIIVAFLVLPCICFGLQAIFHVGDTRRKRDHPSKQATGQVV